MANFVRRVNSYPAKFGEFLAENCPNGSRGVAKVVNFHTKPYIFVAWLPNPYTLSTLGYT